MDSRSIERVRECALFQTETLHPLFTLHSFWSSPLTTRMHWRPRIVIGIRPVRTCCPSTARLSKDIGRCQHCAGHQSHFELCFIHLINFSTWFFVAIGCTGGLYGWRKWVGLSIAVEYYPRQSVLHCDCRHESQPTVSYYASIYYKKQTLKQSQRGSHLIRYAARCALKRRSMCIFSPWFAFPNAVTIDSLAIQLTWLLRGQWLCARGLRAKNKKKSHQTNLRSRVKALCLCSEYTTPTCMYDIAKLMMFNTMQCWWIVCTRYINNT